MINPFYVAFEATSAWFKKTNKKHNSFSVLKFLLQCTSWNNESPMWRENPEVILWLWSSRGSGMLTSVPVAAAIFHLLLLYRFNIHGVWTSPGISACRIPPTYTARRHYGALSVRVVSMDWYMCEEDGRKACKISSGKWLVLLTSPSTKFWIISEVNRFVQLSSAPLIVGG